MNPTMTEPILPGALIVAHIVISKHLKGHLAP